MRVNPDLLERCSIALFKKIFFRLDDNKYNWDTIDEKVKQGIRDEVLVVLTEANKKMELILNPTECPICGQDSGVMPSLEGISKEFTCKSCGEDIHVDYHITYDDEGNIDNDETSFWLSGGKAD